MSVINAIRERKSVRNYNTEKKVNKEEIMTILEAGRLAPNGFGFEHWNFYVVQNKLTNLMEACNNQKHIGDSSFSIVITSPSQKYIQDHMDEFIAPLVKKNYPEANINKMMERLGDLKGDYVHRQTYFPAAQMTIQAASMGIGSTIVGGFNNDLVLNFLNKSIEDEVVGLVISFGYEDGEVPTFEKKALSEIVQWI